MGSIVGASDSKYQATENLDPGDKLEIGMSMQYRPRGGGELWLKAGVTVTVRPGEEPELAFDRAYEVVVGCLNQTVIDIEQESEK